jgi:hypothetical protein
MATNFQLSSGFSLPSINYDLTQPMDLPGAINKGLAFGGRLLDLPNEGRARQITGQQQKKVMDGSLEFMGAKVDPKGGISGEYSDKAIADAERRYAGLRGDNILNTMQNRDANTGANIGYKSGMLGIAGQKAGEYSATQQHTRSVTGRNPNNLYEGWQLPGTGAVTTNPQYIEPPLPTGPDEFDVAMQDMASRAQPSQGYSPMVLPGLPQNSPSNDSLLGSPTGFPGAQPSPPRQPNTASEVPRFSNLGGQLYEIEEVLD